MRRCCDGSIAAIAFKRHRPALHKLAAGGEDDTRARHRISGVSIAQP
jgi:hypothetical protein